MQLLMCGYGLFLIGGFVDSIVVFFVR